MRRRASDTQPLGHLADGERALHLQHHRGPQGVVTLVTTYAGGVLSSRVAIVIGLLVPPTRILAAPDETTVTLDP